MFFTINLDFYLWQKILFLTTFSIFDKNFWQNFRVLIKFLLSQIVRVLNFVFFDKRFNFWHKFKFLTICSIFGPNLYSIFSLKRNFDRHPFQKIKLTPNARGGFLNLLAPKTVNYAASKSLNFASPIGRDSRPIKKVKERKPSVTFILPIGEIGIGGLTNQDSGLGISPALPTKDCQNR